MNLEISIKVFPAINMENRYAVFLTSQMQNDPSTIRHHHNPMGGPLEQMADWVADSVKQHIIARQEDMIVRREQWTATTYGK